MIQFDKCYIKISYDLTSEISQMWGKMKFSHGHDIFDNFTKSLKTTYFGA